MDSRKSRSLLPLVLLAGVLVTAAGRAEEPDPWHPWRLRPWPGKQPYGKGCPVPHTFERAGYPCKVSRCAQPTNNCRYTGYQVGGGSAVRGTGPTTQEGTWGWDYVGGQWFHPRVVLNWCRSRYQGGTEGYKTDGPRVPDLGPLVNEIRKGPHCLRGHEPGAE